MKNDILSIALALSDQDLLARIPSLAGAERESAAELVAHLAALELRPGLYRAQGFGSLFDYCTDAVRLSEDAACNRIRAARMCRQFPVILQRLATGSISLSALRLLQPHLTAQNHEAVLARAANKRCREVQHLVAELAPQPDVPASVRRLPMRSSCGSSPEPSTPSRSIPFTSGTSGEDQAAVGLGSGGSGDAGLGSGGLGNAGFLSAGNVSPGDGLVPSAEREGQNVPLPQRSAPLASHRPILKASAPNRYRVHLTIGQKAHDDLRRVQDLLRREIPSGDIAVIFESALAVLREKVEREKLAQTTRPRRPAVVPGPLPKAEGGYSSAADGGRPSAHGGRQSADGGRQSMDGGHPSVEAGDGSYENRIRRAADKPSRHVPNEVRRQVWRRDDGQCAFRSNDGRRCTETSFVELHHIQPYALDGPATIENIALRCRGHNRYESEAVFGPYRPASPSG